MKFSLPFITSSALGPLILELFLCFWRKHSITFW